MILTFTIVYYYVNSLNSSLPFSFNPSYFFPSLYFAPFLCILSVLFTPLPVSLCVVCGMVAPSRCVRCGKANYCNAYHQMWHWKYGHSKVCKEGAAITKQEAEQIDNVFLFKESELVTEMEPDKACSKSEEDRIAEYKQHAKKLAERVAGGSMDADPSGSISKVNLRDTRGLGY